ncbi:MAG TPA: SH3 domain-containing protein [Acidobacteriaceae bacterium]
MPSYRSACRALLLFLIGSLVLGLAGCSRLRHKPAANYVYVISKQTYLRDRIAAVSTRTAVVTNGQRLEILQTGRKTFQVKTEKGEIGWIKETEVAPGQIAEDFDALKRAHTHDSVVATATVRDELSMHIAPGRDTDKLYLLQEGDKLKLLQRATLPKTRLPIATPKKLPATPPATPATTPAAKPATAPSSTATTPVVDPNIPPPPIMEDWWLVRDAQGRTGWIYSRMMDVDSPDVLTRYAENQRIVSAAILTTVYDPDAEAADKNIPVYVVAYAPYKAGLPYDFDQVRVFTWNKTKHRYETAYRERNMEAFLPLVTGTQLPDAVKDVKLAGSIGTAPLPVFKYKVLADGASIYVDPVTGIPKPGQLIEKDFRVEGNYVRRILLPGQTTTMPQAHPEPPPEKKSAKNAKKKR